MQNPKSAGKRLELAIKERLGSIRKFAKELKASAPDLRGTSRQTLYKYFNGEAEPGQGVIDAAAELLEVRAAWLAADDDGGMTEEQEQARLMREAAKARAAETTSEGWRNVITEVREAFGKGGERLDVAETRMIILHTWGRLWHDGLVFPPGGLGDDREQGQSLPAIERLVTAIEEGIPFSPRPTATAYLGHALGSAFRTLPIGPEELPDEDFHEYVSAICAGLRRLAEAHARGAGTQRSARSGGTAPWEDSHLEEEGHDHA